MWNGQWFRCEIGWIVAHLTTPTLAELQLTSSESSLEDEPEMQKLEAFVERSGCNGTLTKLSLHRFDFPRIQRILVLLHQRLAVLTLVGPRL